MKWLRALRLVIRTAFVADPFRAVLVFTALPLASLSVILFGLWLKMLAEAVLSSDADKAARAVLAVAGSITLQHVLIVALSKLRFTLQEKTSLRFEREMVEMVSAIPGLEHHERPEYLDRLELLRTQRAAFPAAVGAVVMNLGVVAQAVGTGVLLYHLHPVFLALPLLNLVSFVTESKSGAISVEASEATAADVRLARAHFQTATSYGFAKEVRIFGLGDEVLGRHRRAADGVRTRMVQATRRGAKWDAAGGLVAVAAQMAALVFVLQRAGSGAATVGDVILTLRLMSQMNTQIAGIAEATGMLHTTLSVALRYVWLLDYAKGQRAGQGALPAPDAISGGIRLENVTFRYPGTERDILSGFDLHLPPGAVVAVVGDNGAGKTTLVKLLARCYEPTSGRITVDGTDLSTLDPVSWRKRCSAAFQDSARFEFLLGETVGVGDLPNMTDAYAVLMACERSGAGPILEQSPAGLETQLGRRFDGIELSGGQWQRLALARSGMRDPLLLMLDEPTANLDPAAEFSLFETISRWSRRARRSGAITLLVSHRFSTVRMADLIVVVDDGRVAEVGHHDELMARDGLYAELFRLQSAAYA